MPCSGRSDPGRSLLFQAAATRDRFYTSAVSRVFSYLPVLLIIALLAAAVLLGGCRPRGDSGASAKTNPRAWQQQANRSLREEALPLLELGANKDYDRALSLFSKAAEQGDVLAQMHVALVRWRYMNDGEMIVCDYVRETTAPAVKKIADDGDAEAQYLYSEFLYAEAYSLPADDPLWDERRRYLELAAAQSHRLGLRMLALVYANGEGVDKDESGALDYYQQAAKAGDGGSAYHAGCILLKPEFPRHDFKAAHELFVLSAEAGYPTAYYGLGYCSATGVGALADKAAAASFYQQGADLGDPQCFFALGDCYLHGEGVEADIVKARANFEEASARGYGPASEMLHHFDTDPRHRAAPGDGKADS